MKISFSFLLEEQEEAAACVAALRQLQPGIMVRESDRHSPIRHVYLTTKKPGNRCNSNKKC